LRDYLFDAKTGYYLVDKPVGWAWGVAELDPQAHTIIRTPRSEWLDLRSRLLRRHYRLAAAHEYSGLDNIFLGGALAETDEAEHIAPPAYTCLRTGAAYNTEEDMWASARDGDVVVLRKSGTGAEAPLYAIKVLDVRCRKTEYRPVKSYAEAEAWLS
jgi:hypothetical protein